MTDSRRGGFGVTMDGMTTTRVSKRLDAPRARVYAALVDREVVARWKVPSGMTCEVHEFDEFDTDDPALRGEMTITISLSDAEGGTDLVAVHEGLPSGVSAADNETGWREALGRLATLVEG